MSSAYTVHIYYQHDQSLVVRYFESDRRVDEVLIGSEQSADQLERFLRKNLKAHLQVLVFIRSSLAVFGEAQVPSSFSEADIMQYINVEQAQLFPTLEEAIYVDFKILSENVENKKIVVVACNVSFFSELAYLLQSLNIFWVRLGVVQEDLDQSDDKKGAILNLLPWRQYEKKLLQKRQQKVIGVVAISVALIMLIISMLFIRISQLDVKREVALFSNFQEKLSALEAIENLNKQYHLQIQRWSLQVKIARDQYRLLKILEMIEAQRPKDLVLDKVMYDQNSIFLQGRAKNPSLIRVYYNKLKRHDFEGRVRFLGGAGDIKFPFQFEIERNFLSFSDVKGR